MPLPRPLAALAALLLLTACPGTEADEDLDRDGSPAGEDCDDLDAANYPGNFEICDDQDNNCDGVVDAGEGLANAPGWYPDGDGDGRGAEGGTALAACSRPDGYAAFDDDCDDSDPANFPGQDELCDGRDNDCNGAPDADPEGEVDQDRDGVRSCEDCDDDDEFNFPGNEEVCDGQDNDCDDELGDDEFTDVDIDGFPACVDCDDDNFDVYPEAEEQCNGRDDDCVNGADADELGEVDGDNDGHLSCTDCNDDNPAVHPGIAEECDGEDTDCDGNLPADETEDADNDTSVDCADCDDGDPHNFPGNPEVCDGQDNDCDAVANFDPAGEVDSDNDGSPGCVDCDDFVPATFPGAPELCDGADNDCDGVLDWGNSGVQLDGVDDWVALPTFLPTGDALTVEAWVYADALFAGNWGDVVVSKSSAGTAEDLALFADPTGADWQGTLRMAGGLVTQPTTTAVLAQQWVHVAMVWDGSDIHLYVDGALASSGSATGPLALTATGDWALGMRDLGSGPEDFWMGMVDEIRIWDSARTASEIEDNRCGPLDPAEPDLLAYYPLEADLADATGGAAATAMGDAALAVR